MAQPGLERLVRDQEVEGSNPSIPTRLFLLLCLGFLAATEDPFQRFLESFKAKIPQERPVVPEIQVKRITFPEKDLLARLVPGARKTFESPLVRVFETEDGRMLELYSDGSLVFTDPLREEELQAPATPRTLARKIAEDFLTDFGGLPEDAKLHRAESITGEKGLQILFFEYYHEFYGLPVERDLIRVSVSAGRVVEFVFGWTKPVNEGKPRKVISAEEGIKKALAFYFQRILGGKLYQPVEIQEVRLLYSWKDPRKKRVLVPVWRVKVALRGEVVGGRQKQKSLFVQVLRVNAHTGEVIPE